jgi:putative peptidoglycan lipid II flippase
MQTSRAILQQVVTATLSIVLGNLPGLILPILLARVVGATIETDILFLTLALVGFIVNTISSVAETANIPFIHQVRNRGGSVSSYRTGITLLLSGISILLNLGLSIVLAFSWRHLGFTADYAGRVVKSMLWMTPYLVFAASASVLKGFLLAQERFFLPLISSAVTPLIVASTAVYWGGGRVLHACLIGFCVGEGVKVMLLSLCSRSSPGLVIQEDVRGTTRYSVVAFLKASVYQALGLTILSLYPVIDRLLASRIGEGQASLLSYAERMWQVPIGALTGGMLPVLLVSISSEIAKGGDVRRVVSRTPLIAFLAFAGACLLCLPLYFLRGVIFKVLFGTASLDGGALTTLSSVFMGLLVGVPTYVAGLAYTRVVIALRMNSWLLYIGIGELVLKCVLNVLLAAKYKVVGLALATSLMYTAGTAALVLLFAIGFESTKSYPAEAR